MEVVIVQRFVPSSLCFPQCLQEKLSTDYDGTEETVGVIGRCDAVHDLAFRFGEEQLVTIRDRNSECVLQAIRKAKGQLRKQKTDKSTTGH